jgi:hypothetical protein
MAYPTVLKGSRILAPDEIRGTSGEMDIEMSPIVDMDTAPDPTLKGSHVLAPDNVRGTKLIIHVIIEMSPVVDMEHRLPRP